MAIRDFWLRILSQDTTRRTLTQVSACCEWAIKAELIQINPFKGMAKDILPGKKAVRMGRGETIDPFSREERDAIIQAFADHPYHKYYLPFVKFLFWTGCRFGEAIALQWKHISRDFKTITFEESVSTRLKIRKEPKNRKVRLFPCTPQLQALLREIKPEAVDPEKAVFPGKGSELLDGAHFLKIWKGYSRTGRKTEGVVLKLIRESRVQRYRVPYNCRHTFISECLEAGISVAQVTSWVGNSPETIFRFYCGVANKAMPPEF
jgi:integrase